MLSAQQILTASFTDILFQARNRAYGAYQLRRQYPAHLGVALAIMLGSCLVAFVWYYSGNPGGSDIARKVFLPPDPPPMENWDDPIIPPPPPPPAPVSVQTFRMEVFTPPLITVDHAVDPNELPPAQDQLQDALIGLQKKDGDDAMNMVAPPSEEKGTGLAVAPPGTEERKADDIVIWVSQEAEFPGGMQAWIRYLQRYLKYPEPAVENEMEGTVSVQFVIDRDGYISEVQALNDPGYGLAEEAVRIIKSGPRWKPAEQNGKKVKYRQIQKVGFRLQ